MISSNLKLHKILLVLLFVGSLYSQTLTRRVWIDSLFYNDGTNTYVHYNFAEDTLVTNYKGTAHRVLYIDASGDVTELAYGSSGQVLKSNGATSAPSWQADVSGAGGSSYADSIVHDTRHVIGDSLITDDEGAARYEPIDAAIVKSDEAETLTANWVNTAYPWADNEVADNITASSYTLLTAVGDSVEANAYYPGGTDVADADVADNITVTNYLLLTAVNDSLSSITDDTTNFQTAYTHSQDNTQAHTDYLLNNASDATSGDLTATGFIIGSADIDEAELEIIDGATVTTTELNSLTAVLADTTEYKTETRNFTIAYPDSLMDDIRIAEFPATLYPNGVTLTYLSISASASCTDTHIFEEWSDMIGTSQSTVHSLAISGAVRAETSSPTDDEIAAGGYLNLNMDDSTDDLDLILVTYRFYPTP